MAREHELLAHSSWLQVRRHCEAPFLQQLRGGPAAAHDGHSMRFQVQVRPPTADRQELMPCTFLPVLSALLGTKKKETKTKAVCIALADAPLLLLPAACCQLPYLVASCQLPADEIRNSRPWSWSDWPWPLSPQSDA
jgi:hypothetical protein